MGRYTDRKQLLALAERVGIRVMLKLARIEFGFVNVYVRCSLFSKTEKPTASGFSYRSHQKAYLLA